MTCKCLLSKHKIKKTKMFVILKRCSHVFLFNFSISHTTLNLNVSAILFYLFVVLASGFRRTKITESPRKNIFEMKRSLFTGLTFFFPLPVRGISVHISLTLNIRTKQNKKELMKLRIV